MLALRLVRGASPTALLRRLLLVLATAGVGFLLLAELSHALAHPDRPTRAAIGLLWCLLPLAATVQLAAAVARTEQNAHTRSGLDAAGIGAARLPALTASSVAVSCLFGSGLALLLHLHLRGGPATLPYGGSAAELLAADRPFPSPAALTLLCLAPAAAAVGGAVATRTRPSARPLAPADADATNPDAQSERRPSPGYVAGLLWGIATLAVGLCIEVYAARVASGTAAVAAAVVGGWVLLVLGLTRVVPALAQCAGSLLAHGRPNVVRLLAGRALEGDVEGAGARLAQPLGLGCAVAAGAVTAGSVHSSLTDVLDRLAGPLTTLGAALVVCCIAAGALIGLAEARAGRAPSHAALVRLGAPRRVLRRARAVRSAVVLLVVVGVAWGVGTLAALPFR